MGLSWPTATMSRVLWLYLCGTEQARSDDVSSPLLIHRQKTLENRFIMVSKHGYEVIFLRKFRDSPRVPRRVDEKPSKNSFTNYNFTCFYTIFVDVTSSLMLLQQKMLRKSLLRYQSSIVPRPRPCNGAHYAGDLGALCAPAPVLGGFFLGGPYREKILVTRGQNFSQFSEKSLLF